MSAPKGFSDSPRSISSSAVAPHGKLRSILDNLVQGIVLIDSDLYIEFCNQRFLQMYNVALPPSRKLLECFNDNSGDVLGGAFVVHLRQLGDALKNSRAFNTIVNLLDGRTISIVGNPIAPDRWLLIHEDVTERERTQERMIRMARHDALTELPNRVLLRERLEQEIKRVKRGDGLAVMCLDLDLFKSVNDTLGHPIGDELLKCVADRLRGCTREPDTVARLGGDEFAIIMTQLQSPTDATALARRIQGSIGQPYHIEEHQIVTGISIGIAIAPDDGMDADVLMKHADLALYGAKADGRNTYRFFESEMDARMKARRGLELDLRRAIATQAFELHYQPLVSVRDNEITALEALLRWNHASRGVISPAEFIPIAEETGLIIPIGEWVLRTACKEATRWPEHVKVAVNVSPVQLKSRQFLTMIQSAFAETKLPPHRLQLEITESVLMQDTAPTFETLNALRTLGVQIALDDFGTGYSSLSYLRSFPFDKIKIDRSFIKDLANGKEPLAIVHAVADLANCLNMISTAEGVETQQQFDALQSIGCNEMQGYLFSRAQPAKEVYKFFNETSRIVA